MNSIRSFRWTVVSPWALLWALVIGAWPAAAQSDVVDLPDVIGADQRINIAVPYALHRGGSAESAVELVETLRADLEFSGYFKVVDPRMYELAETGPDGVPNPASWKEIGASATTRLKMDVQGRQIALDAYVYDNESGTLLLGRRYAGTTTIVRRIAHQLADDILKQFTGADGIAQSLITFVAKHDGGKEIYLMDYDGARIRRLTTTGDVNLTPAWSPDGEKLAYAALSSASAPAVWVMQSTGQLSDLPTVKAVLSFAPEWSPDGNTLLYAADVEGNGNTELFALDRRTNRNRQLTRHPMIDSAPAFSPNGREVAFTSDRTGSPQIYIMDIDGVNTRRVTWEGNYNDSAAWSPDGEWMAYVSRVTGKFQIHLLNLRTEKVVRLPGQSGNNENPRWSPDGRYLVFSSDRTGGYDIYVMARDGSGVRRLTKSGDSITPDWSR